MPLTQSANPAKPVAVIHRGFSFELGVITPNVKNRTLRNLLARDCAVLFKRLGGHARCVLIDLDPTDVATHGAQRLSFFNAHYDNWCYLPTMGFVSLYDVPNQQSCEESDAGRTPHRSILSRECQQSSIRMNPE
jgi:hypothetical protein